MTGRELIHSSLRIVNAIRQNELPEYGMLESARETLNLMLGSWSAEELMPHHYLRHKFPLFANVPNYTIDAGDGFDSDGVCQSQKPAAGGSQSLTINGTYASSGVATMDVPRHVIIYSDADDSDRTFTVVGTTEYGDSLTEVITGPNATVVRGDQRFKTVTSVTIDGNSTGNVAVGSDYIVNIRPPIKVVSAMLRTSAGLDTPLKVINRERYDDIIDKDATGAPTTVFYDRSTPATELYVYPVPSTGIVLDDNSGTECITNGGFASSANWTLGTLWSISGGKLEHAGVAKIEYLTDPNMTNDSLWSHDPSQAGWWSFDDPGYTYTDNGNTAGINTIYADTAATYDTPLVAGETYTVTITLSGIATDANDCEIKIFSYSAASGTDYLATIKDGVADISMDGEEFEITMPLDWGGSIATHHIGLNFYGFDYEFTITQFSVSQTNDTTNTASQVSGDLANALSSGTLYAVSFDISDYSAGTLTPALGNASGPSASWDGSYYAEITAGADGDFDLDCTGSFIGKIDDVSVVDLPYPSLTPQDYELLVDLWMPFVEIDADELDDEINLPGEYLLALRWNLAAELAPEYGKGTSLYVPYRAKQTKETIKMLNGLIPKEMMQKTPIPQIGKQLAVSQI